MISEKIDENNYEITVYDWGNAIDYVFGYVKKDSNADEDDDASFFRFYPIGSKLPVTAGDLKQISEFIAKLNTDSIN